MNKMLLLLSISITFILSASAQETLLGEYKSDPSTVLLMHMNEASGPTVSDASGANRVGTIQSGVTFSSGRFGNAATFANQGYFSVAHDSALNLQDITIEMWLYPTNLSFPLTGADPAFGLVAKRSSNVPQPYTAAIGNPNSLWLNGHYGTGWNTGASDSAGLVNNQWQHVAFSRSFSGSQVRYVFYVNGKEMGHSSYTLSAATTNTHPLWVGKDPYHSVFTDQGTYQGKIDELRISNTIRQPYEFNLQLPPINLTATPSGATVNLSWQNGGGATPLMRYRIYRGLDSINVILIDSTLTNFKVNVTTLYYYRISSVDSTGFEGAKSFAVYTPTPSGNNAHSLVAFYPFSGNTDDSSGNGNNGTNNGATPTTDRFGMPNRAYSFNGTSNDIQVADDSTINFANGQNFTVGTWIKSTPTQTQTVYAVGKYNSYSGAGGYILSLTSDGFIYFDGRDQLGYRYTGNGSKKINDNSWHFVVGIRNGSEWSIWVDGIKEDSIDAGNTTAVHNGNPLWIGALADGTYPVGGFFSGSLDDIRIYNCALSVAEIDSLYHEGGWGTYNVVSLDSITATQGDTVSIPVRATLLPSKLYSAIEANLGGFKGALQYIGIDTTNTLLGQKHWTYQVNGSDSLALTAFAGSEEISGSGILFRAKFKVIGNPCSFATITLPFFKFDSGTDSVKKLDGGVNIKARPFFGDADQNGKVEALDASTILKHVVGKNSLQCQGLANADVTANGVVTGLDATAVLKYVVKLITTFPADSATMGPLSAGGSFAWQSSSAPNGRIDVSLRLSDGRNILSFEKMIHYDPTFLKLESITYPSTLDGFLKESNSDVNNGTIQIVGAGSLPDGQTGTFVTFRFTPLKAGQTSVTLDQFRLNEENIQTVKLSTGVTTSVSGEIVLPRQYALEQNYPNPFNPATTFSIALPKSGPTSLKIFNTLGVEVATVYQGALQAGNHQFQWSAAKLASGVYFYRLQSGEYTATKKLILLK
jgi:hypothetical protein